MTSCHSQQKNKATQINVQAKTGLEYLLGSWRFIEKNYSDGAERRIYPLHECMKFYTLQFESLKGKSFLTKNYSTGKDCSVKSSSGKISVVINESSISYTEADLIRKEQYEIISKNKFSIIYNDILNGKVREIEDVYERQ